MANEKPEIARIGKDELGKASSLILDCANGARKGALTSSLLAALDDSLRKQFLDDFNKAFQDGPSASIEFEKADDAECVKFVLKSDGSEEASSHHDGETHHGRSLANVSYIIENIELDGKVIEDAIGVYGVLADAEAKAHDTFPGSVHFHEVGNDFAIASIVAFCMLANRIGPKHLLATPITTGFGFVECAHGRVSIPAPATANILQGLPSSVGNVEGELATPTGAAIVSYFAESFIEESDLEKMTVEAPCVIGDGADVPRLGAIRSVIQFGD